MKTGVHIFGNLRISPLKSGGIIPNYRCSATCGHCLYACSPLRDTQFLDEDMAGKIADKLIAAGQPAIHIGGGEPMLEIENLYRVLRVFSNKGLHIDYIETNSSWHKNREHDLNVLTKLRSLQIRTMLLSISPFHNEFVPLNYVLEVMDSCEKAGMNVFPWIEEFIEPLKALNIEKPHPVSAFEDIYGSGYEAELPRHYWIHFGGRAISRFQHKLPLRPLAEILDSGSCGELLNASHFHIDLYGNYIPALCTGLAIDMADVESPLDHETYPLITILYKDGVRGLLSMAQDQWDFQPEDMYLGKCHLCLSIRVHLSSNGYVASRELAPKEFYKEPSISLL